MEAVLNRVKEGQIHETSKVNGTLPSGVSIYQDRTQKVKADYRCRGENTITVRLALQ
jgi:hypothetical protein